MSNSWLQRPVPRPRAQTRLFCFPYAGVGAAVYRSWPTGLPEEVEMCAIQLPGRANRLHEPACASIPALVNSLMHALLPHLDLPFAFFGHSMGAVLAYEVVRALHSCGGPLPKHLVLSSRRPPHVPDPEPPLHVLPDDRFVAEIECRYGGIPPEVKAEPDLMALLLPCLRADIEALETFHPPPRPALPLPITVFGGLFDQMVPQSHLEAWRSETSAAFRVHTFAGGHFYMDSHRVDLLRRLLECLPLPARPVRVARALS